MYALRSGPLYSQLQDLWHNVPYQDRDYIFGDPAYVDGLGIITNFTGRPDNLGQCQRQLQRLLASLRCYVEWSFAEVLNHFPFLREGYKMRLQHSPIGIWLEVAILLFNCRQCLYGNLTNEFFDCPPPSLDDFLNM